MDLIVVGEGVMPQGLRVILRMALLLDRSLVD